MRTLRLSLAGTGIIALLGGLGGVALAQDDTDTVKATHFTGTRLDAVEGAIDEEWWGADGSLHLRGGRATETYEWSDARLPSEMQIVQNLVAPGSSGTVFGTTLLEAPEGYWTGEFTAYCDVDRECYAMNTMIGHEAYEGLFAVARGFYADGPASDWVIEGLIFEGEMPPMPEAPEPLGAAAAPTEGVMAESDESEDAAVEDGQEPEAVAQAEEPEASADEGDDELSGTAAYIEGLRTWVDGAEGEPHRYRLTMSDDRASGTYTETYEGIGHLYDGDSLRPSIVALDPVTLTNDEGGWAGLQSAVWDDEMGWRLTAWLAGEDAYEGLTLYLHAHRFPVYSTPEMEFDGIIFEGEPPVMLEAVSLPTE